MQMPCSQLEPTRRQPHRVLTLGDTVRTVLGGVGAQVVRDRGRAANIGKMTADFAFHSRFANVRNGKEREQESIVVRYHVFVVTYIWATCVKRVAGVTISDYAQSK